MLHRHGITGLAEMSLLGGVSIFWSDIQAQVEMRCEGCLSKIQEAASSIEGVNSVDGDLTAKEIIVSYAKGHNIKRRLVRRLIDLGHEVTRTGRQDTSLDYAMF